MLNSVPAAAPLYGVLACWSDGWCRDSVPEAAVVKQAVMLLFFIPVEFGQNVSDYKTMGSRINGVLCSLFVLHCWPWGGTR